MPGLMARRDMIPREMPGARRRMEKARELPALPQNAASQPPREFKASSSRPSWLGAASGRARQVSSTVVDGVNTAGHATSGIGSDMSSIVLSLEDEGWDALKTKAAELKANPRSPFLWFFDKYKQITNS